MSPTYWTATQIINTARQLGWEILPCVAPDTVWTIRQGRHRVRVQERRDGGLTWVSFTYPVSDGSNCDYLGPRCRNKLGEVLTFLNDPTCRQPRYVMYHGDTNRIAGSDTASWPTLGSTTLGGGETK